jgi:hypothetical protein
MTTTYFRWFLPLFFLTGLSKMTAQTNPIVVPKAYESEKDTVKQFFKGDVMAIEPDSVYLLNQMRFTQYQLLMQFKLEVGKHNADIQKIFNDLVQSITKDLAHLEQLNKQMKRNADSTSAIGQRLADVTSRNALRADSALDSAQKLLKTAQARLDTADAHLVLANKLIDKERKDRFWRSLKWGAIGVGVGILIRSFVINKP